MDGIVTSQLLINIFEHNTPLHDGAVIIRGNRVTAATCYLPLSDNLSISKDLGTRHRAALGISETSDSLTVVVSEETGRVSLARDGQLTRISDQETLRQAIPWKRERILGQDGSGYGREDIKMKEKQNKRWGLKLLSVLCAFLVWLGVVNVADPVMTSTVEVPVEIVNGEVLEASGLTYEIIGKKDDHRVV